MSEQKEYISKRGQRLSPQFIEQMEKGKTRFAHPRTPEEKLNLSIKQKEINLRRRTFKEVARMLLEMKPDAKTIKKLKEVVPGLDEEQITNRLAMTQKMVEKALAGDNYAFQVIRDTAGEKPIEKQEVVGTVANTYTQIDKNELKQALIDAKKVLNELE